MSNTAVAYRYAKSLLELAQEKGVTESIQKDMQLFDNVCNENRAFELALKSPVVKHLKKLEILRAIFKGKVDPMTLSIFEIITNKNRESVLPELATEYLRLFDVYKNNLIAEVTSVAELTEEQRKSFIKIVADATGKNVSLKETIKADLIGGYILKVGDKQIDTSVKKRLNDLKISFLN
jgi:F-type H+-transporting ATPase subunit delta